MSSDERELLQECIAMLEQIGIRHIHLKNNINQQKYRSNVYKQYKGWSDLTIFLPGGKTIFVELKMPAGIVSDDQKDFMQSMQKSGYTCHVVRSYADFMDLIINYIQ